jgi:hypothetical protein
LDRTSPVRINSKSTSATVCHVILLLDFITVTTRVVSQFGLTMLVVESAELAGRARADVECCAASGVLKEFVGWFVAAVVDV